MSDQHAVQAEQPSASSPARHRWLNGVITFGLFFALWPIKDSVPHTSQGFFAFLVGVVAVALAYFIYYIISEGQWKKIVIGILISLAITVASVVFPPLAALAVIYLVYSLFKSAKAVLSLLPYFLLSVLYFLVLFTPQVLAVPGIAEINAMEVYTNASTGGLDWFLKLQAKQIYFYSMVAVSLICAWASSKPRLKQSILAVALIWIAVPLVVLIIYSMRAALQNIFKTEVHLRQVEMKDPQPVASYVRADGTEVASYTREVSKAATEVTTTQTIGTGAAIAGAAETIASGVVKAKMEPKKAAQAVGSTVKNS